MTCRETDVAMAYLCARARLLRAGYAEELDWQESVVGQPLTEGRFLAETAWVILCAGMRESVIRGRFLEISRAFNRWQSAEWIVANQQSCRHAALSYFRHEGKIDAIISVASLVAELGIDYVSARLREDPWGFLTALPYIGEITARHLAKNIGLDTAKHDRHLVRIANSFGYGGAVDLMCEEVSKLTGHKVAVIDLVFWRFASTNSGYLEDLAVMASFGPEDCGNSDRTASCRSVGRRGDRATFPCQLA
jgi:hypothetical protein